MIYINRFFLIVFGTFLLSSCSLEDNMEHKRNELIVNYKNISPSFKYPNNDTIYTKPNFILGLSFSKLIDISKSDNFLRIVNISDPNDEITALPNKVSRFSKLTVISDKDNAKIIETIDNGIDTTKFILPKSSNALYYVKNNYVFSVSESNDFIGTLLYYYPTNPPTHTGIYKVTLEHNPRSGRFLVDGYGVPLNLNLQSQYDKVDFVIKVITLTDSIKILRAYAYPLNRINMKFNYQIEGPEDINFEDFTVFSWDAINTQYTQFNISDFGSIRYSPKDSLISLITTGRIIQKNAQVPTVAYKLSNYVDNKFIKEATEKTLILEQFPTTEIITGVQLNFFIDSIVAVCKTRFRIYFNSNIGLNQSIDNTYFQIEINEPNNILDPLTYSVVKVVDNTILIKLDNNDITAKGEIIRYNPDGKGIVATDSKITILKDFISENYESVRDLNKPYVVTNYHTGNTCPTF